MTSGRLLVILLVFPWCLAAYWLAYWWVRPSFWRRLRLWLTPALQSLFRHLLCWVRLQEARSALRWQRAVWPDVT